MIAHVIVELLPPNTGRAFEAMRELRPALIDRGAFVGRVDEIQRPLGYRLVAAVEDEVGPALAVAGFRIGENLAWGRYLYVDDLSTVPRARQRGCAQELLRWLHDEAVRVGSRQVHLDSGVGVERVAAHRLYFNAGYRISSHHFAREV
ncbi:MAG TPA: GNAT family N-acetyltransferase [Nocardioidaceae bacterium]|nr:GNAT family N-acetyltransferase [Nocardioidaceae bacterium]